MMKKQQTVYIEENLLKQIKVFCIENDLQISSFAEEAFKEKLKRERSNNEREQKH